MNQQPALPSCITAAIDGPQLAIPALSLHRLFLQRAEGNPDAPALLDGAAQCSYGQLQQKVLSLAHALRAQGAGPGQRVAVCALRGMDLISALLAVLATGAAYVPLDPEWPQERLQWILQDSQAQILLCAGLDCAQPHSLPQKLLQAHACRLFDLGAFDWAAANSAALPAVNAQDSAYLIYTSGSTGRPKGVEITHGNAVNFIVWAQHAFPTLAQECTAFVTSVNFDLSIFEIFAPLAAGGRVRIFANAIALADGAHDVSLLNTVPSALAALLELGALPPAVHNVNLAGEPLKAQLAQRLFAETPVRTLCNLYGPSETTTYSTWVKMERTQGFAPHIGQPIANTRIYLLDEARQPVAPGQIGEIWIGGAGVARGYFGQPALSSERFVADPQQAGAQIYKTGDRGRILPDGNLEYLGRNDFQLKIRGFRIEPGEIEARIAELPQIREVAVDACPDAAGEMRLAAWYSLRNGAAAPSQAALRAHLQDKLPHWMQPSAWLCLAALPQTPNGKLDRKALPPPDFKQVMQGSQARGPREELLAAIVCACLRLPAITREANLFTLGMHSLQALQVLGKIWRACGVKLQPADIQTAPSIAELANLLEQRAAHAAATPPALQANLARQPGQPLHAPATPEQQRLFFIQQMQTGSQAYHLSLGFALQGALDVAALERAYAQLQTRHASLRTVFALHDGAVQQIILPQGAASLRQHDLRELPAAQRQAQAAQLAQASAAAAYDLGQGPLVRLLLLRLDHSAWELHLQQHHIISDGWSQQLLLQDLAAFYQAALSGAAPALNPAPLDMADYACWRAQQDSSAGLAYWRQTLEGAPALLDMPLDFPRPAQQDHQGASLPLQFDAALVAALQTRAESQGLTLYMLLLAAWAALLARYSGQDEVVIGAPAANRALPELEQISGFFANTIALRISLQDDPTFAALLQHCRSQLWGALAHQDVPFDSVVQALRPLRSLAYNPLFQTMLSLNSSAEASLPPLPGLSSRALPPCASAAMFDLSLHLEQDGAGIHGELSYASALFKPGSAARLAHSFSVLLRAMAQAETALLRISALPLLDQAARQEVLYDFNQTSLAFPQQACLHHLFEASVARQPQAIALLHQTQSYSYETLNRMANRVAHALLALGIQADTRIALCCPRTPHLAAALLGILKAGAAYVPLDIDYPPQRLAHMLTDSQTRALLHAGALPAALEQEFSPALNTLPRIDLLALLEEASVPAQEHNPALPLDASQLAYIIYTSGSTGKSKGVAIEHRQAVNFVSWSRQAFPHLGQETVLFATSINFDLSIFEFFATLAAGGRVRLLRNALDIASAGQDGTLINSVPSALAALADIDGIPPGVHTINLAGEPLKQALVQRMFASSRVQRICNLYGPSETTTYSTWCEMDRASGFVSHIGKPLANTQIYILDSQMQPAPVGVVGEMWIGGDGVARGYLLRPDLSAERFLDNPFAPGRLYKTGDLGRWRADGNLDYLGRNDFQVKIRGFRIEPGEIEARLAELPQVRDAVVLARADAPGDMRLVAYLTAASGQQLEAAACRAHLAAHLPEFMLPSAFVLLDTLPLTPNGKLDRKALPAPDYAQLAARSQDAPPQGEIENALAQIFCRVLQLPQISRHASFFELGGHSLLALQLLNQIGRAFGLSLNVRQLFEAPSVAQLAQLLPGARASLPPLQAVPRQPGQALHAPATAEQQRLFFIQQMQTGSQAYHLSLGFALQGALDVAALERAYAQLQTRHASLRTVFALHDGAVQQIILPQGAASLRQHDLRELPAAQRQAQAAQLAQASAAAAYDLGQGPLVRLLLLRLDHSAWELHLQQHHIISDGWSQQLLLQDLAAFYQAALSGAAPALNPAPLDMADYACWRAQQDSSAGLAYWRQTLEGAPALLDMPLDFPRPAQQDHQGASLPLQFDAALVAALQTRAESQGLTLYMLLLAAWAALLARYSGQDEVVIGAPAANRALPELEQISGFFANTIALRISLQDDPTFAALLQHCRSQLWGALAHQDVPFDSVVQALRPLRSLAYNPLFQTMLSLNSSAEASLPPLPGLSSRALPPCASAAMFDLSLHLEQDGAGIHGELSYASALFKPESAARLAHSFSVLLRAMAQAETALLRISALPLLDQAARQEVLYDFNQTSLAFPQQACLHHLFEASVARQPQAIALLHQTQSYSYETLNRMANRVAHALLALGIQADTRIALCCPRTPHLAAALLGILKAGAAYVPLDIDYPPQRLAHMLADSQARALLHAGALPAALEQEFSPALNTLPRIDLLALLEQASVPAQEHNPALPLDASQLAYIIYTSGSTGKSKGVAIEHRQAVNFVSWSRQAFPHLGQETVLFATSINFDLSIFEFFATLAAGGRVRLLRNALDIASAGQDGTLINSVPSALAALADIDGIPPGVHTINLAGEPLKQALVQRLFASSRVQRICNLYGPSETTTYSTWCEMDRASGFVSHIGKPLANTQIYILDSQMQPAPVGVVGEMWIGGDGVARGYLLRPDLSAERFLDNPFAPGRLYKTGDLGRWRADGNLDYLGRNDFQVKIRGFRIEPGEIEARLAELPQVRDAVVLARADAPGDMRLVAYLTAASGQQLEAAACRAHLAAHLPEFMLPSAFVLLDTLPLTPNGKLDRKALPAPDYAQLAARSQDAPPQGEIENALAQIFCRVLQLPQISRHASFFELGGHSLLALQLLNQLKQYGLSVTLRELFAAPDVAQLARLAQSNRVSQTAAALAPLKRLGRQRAPASAAQQRLWFMHQLQGDSLAYHLPLCFSLQGALDVAALQSACDTLCARHEILRTTFMEQDGRAWQVAQPAGAADFTCLTVSADSLSGAAAEADTLLAQLCRQSFDLERGPLLRFCLLQLDAQHWRFLILQHHIISDGWSFGLLLQELDQLYRAAIQGAPAALPAPALQFSDYAHWLEQAPQQAAQQAALAFWRERLAGAPPQLELPGDFPRPPYSTHRAGTHALTFDAALLAQLQECAQSHQLTLYMLLLAAWALLLARSANQDCVVIGSPSANRPLADMAALPGFFANTLALPVRIAPHASLAAYLQATRELVLAAQDAQLAPFDLVVEALRPERSLALNPIFQAALAWNNTAQHNQFSLGGLALHSCPAPQLDTPFDILLNIEHSANRLQAEILYSAELFSAARIDDLAQSLHALLQAICAPQAADCSVLRLNMLSDAQLERIHKRFNPAPQALPPLSVLDLAAQQAAAAPAAIALSDDSTQTLSRAALQQRANQLAHYLLHAGLGRGQVAAICLERSFDSVIAMLAVLKTGAAYLPLDPSHPPQRIADLCQDAQVQLALCTAATQSALPSGLRCVALDQIESGLAAQDSSAPQITLQAQDLACLFYTSGSSGKPKGVMVEHGNLLRLVYHNPFAPLTQDDCISHCANIAFDAASWEVWGGLSAGARIHIIKTGQMLDADSLRAQITAGGISALWLTVGLFNALALELGECLRQLRYVLVGGDVLDVQRIAAVLRHPHRPQQLISCYGPTETTTFATTWPIQEADLQRCSIPLGHPIANTSVWVVDGEGQLQAPGVVGELLIGGAGVARAYLKRPDLTQERFIADHFSGQPGARLYRSGDLGRWLPDGRLEFAGRNDAQVKIRGFRIELGEIEARLSSHAAVQSCTVLALEDAVRGKYLAAYWVAQPGQRASAAELRHALAQQLPDYMTPAIFMELAALPLNANGKLDKRALPPPRLTLEAGQDEAPIGELEQTLCQIWSELLRIPEAGRNANFFELGGHSLLATRLASRLRQLYDLPHVLPWIFAAPTPAAMAQKIDEHNLQHTDADTLQALLDQLESMSDEDASATLAHAMPSLESQPS
ncbi:amino acid adenylation domain-containing protein [Massilia sp. W12]|uniref:amino acid adenylation domain-containing protein n=1 Tax=Massilia sp. W12 TaxID=3126507 RepID=UPI0030CC47CE